MFFRTGMFVIVCLLVGTTLVSCIAQPGLMLAVPQVIAEQSETISSSSQSGPMSRIGAEVEMSTGQSVAVDCQLADADYPYRPYDWPEASAMLDFMQHDGKSSVRIEVANVRPDTYYTMWLRLGGKDAKGVAYGGSPLTGIVGTPLLPTSELDNALEATGQGNGRVGGMNGFYSDEDGNATFEIELDFPIINGAYPFQKWENFDSQNERFAAENPRIVPVAIVGPGGPFTMRLVSHCTDGVGHGLVPGPHEGWFQWSFES